MIRKELAVFLVVGCLTVLIDFCFYRMLISFGLNVEAAKAAGFLAGTLFAYFANRFWTFGHKSSDAGSIWRFIVLYVATLITNVLVNSLGLKVFADTVAPVQLAFLIATGFNCLPEFFRHEVFCIRKGYFDGD